MNKVVEVNAGLCTGTLRAKTIEDEINKQAADGWKFEKFETIIGRCCLFFQRYKMLLCFSKENAKTEELREAVQVQNEQSDISFSVSPIIIKFFFLAVVAVLVLIDVFLNEAASLKLIASIFLPGFVAPVGSSVSDGLQWIALIPDIWIIVLVIFGIRSALKPKKKDSAGKEPLRITLSITALKIAGAVIGVAVLAGIVLFGVSKIKFAPSAFFSSKTTVVSSDKSIKTDLVGTWICKDGWRSETLTFKKNGTFEYNGNYNHGGPEQLSVGPDGELTTRVGFDSTGTYEITKTTDENISRNISHWTFKTFLNYGIGSLDIQEGTQIDRELIVISKDEFQMGRQIFIRQQ